MEDFIEKKANEIGKHPVRTSIKLLVGIMFIAFVVNIVGSSFGYFSDAAAVAKKEFGPKAALTKYEWFIDASNQIEKKKKDVIIYQSKIDDMCDKIYDRYTGEQCMTWYQELAGIKSSYNDLVADYNSQSQKFNWSMFNTKTPIPKQYKTK